MSLYTPSTSEIVTQAFIEFCCEAYQMDHKGFHGFEHWMRVLHNGRLLASAEGANIKVVELFSLLHDTQRFNENRDPEHLSTGGDRDSTSDHELSDDDKSTSDKPKYNDKQVAGLFKTMIDQSGAKSSRSLSSAVYN